MERRLSEELVILLSVFKWVIFATMAGIIVGLSTSIFLRALSWSIDFSNQYKYFFLLLPLAMFISVLMTTYLAPDAKGHGTEKVIEAVHKSSGRIKGSVVPVKALATIITIAAGGSVGKEGPCAQIGGGLSSLFADLLKFDDEDRKKLVICGISAGFASVFGTPVAGAIFGVEVLFIGAIMYDILLPSFIAGITSFQISNYLGVTYFHHPLNFTPVFSEVFFTKVLIAGVFFGICSFFMIEMIKWGATLSKKIDKTGIYKSLIAGTLLVILTFIFSKKFLGLGLNTIQNALEGGEIVWYAFLIKILFTSITLNFGGSGGIVTPIFFIGAAFGGLIAPLLQLDPSTCASIGLVALLAGTANTPIAASIMAMELFGADIAPYAAVACVVSFIVTGHRSVYPSQILGIKKSRSIIINTGDEIENTNIQVQLRHQGYLIKAKRIIKNINNRLNKRKK